VVEEVAGLPLSVDEPALIEITIDRLEDRDAASCLVDGEPLSRRELERLRELARDLSRSRLDQAGRVNALLGRVQVARVGGDKAFRVSAFVHLPACIGSLERKDDPARRTLISRAALTVRRTGEMKLATVDGDIRGKARPSPPGSPTRPSGGLDAHRRRNQRLELQASAGRPLEQLRGAGAMARLRADPRCRTMREVRQDEDESGCFRRGAWTLRRRRLGLRVTTDFCPIFACLPAPLRGGSAADAHAARS